MAKNYLSGITLQIGGDTTELSKALEEPNKEAKDLQDKLKAVNQALKLDPTNVDLLAQKQRLLREAIENTEKRLNTLKQAQEEFISSGKDVDSRAYIELEKQIAQTEKKLKDLNDESSQLSKTGIDLSGKLNEVGNTMQSVSQKTEKLSKAAAGLMTAVFATVPATDELRQDLSYLEQNAQAAGISISEAEKAFDTFNNVINETDSSVEAVSNLLQAGFTESNLQKAVEGLTGAYIRFPDTMKVESLADSLQETLATGNATGQFAELLDRLGVSADTFSEQLAQCTTEAEKQELALRVLAENGLNDAYTSYAETNQAMIESRQATQDLQEAMADLAETVMPVLTEFTSLAADLVSWFSNLDQKTQMFIGVIVALVAAISPVTGIIGSIAAAAAALNISMLPIIGTIAAIAAAVVALVAVFIYWDEICEWVSKQWEAFTEMIGDVWDDFTEWFKETIDGFINGIVSFFEGMVNSISTFFTVTIPSKINEFIEFFKSIPSMIGSFIQSIINWFNQLPYQLGYLLGQALGHLIQFGINLKNFVTVDIPNFINSVIDWFSKLPGEIWKWLCEAINNIVSWGNDVYTTATTWVSNTIDSVVSFFQSLPGKIWTWLCNAVDDVASWGTDLWNEGTAAAGELVSAVVEGVASLPGEMLSIGEDLVEGLWNGISNMVGWIGNQIGSFADGVVSGLKDFFGIQSPSKLMRDLIGENIAAGIGEGIAQNENLVLNPLDDLQRKMSNVNLSSDLSGSVNKMLDYDNSIVVTVPINANLDGKPIYQNVVTRITKSQGLRNQFKGGF